MFKAISFRKGDGVLLILSILLKSFLEDHLMNKTGGGEKKKGGGIEDPASALKCMSSKKIYTKH